MAMICWLIWLSSLARMCRPVRPGVDWLEASAGDSRAEVPATLLRTAFEEQTWFTSCQQARVPGVEGVHLTNVRVDEEQKPEWSSYRVSGVAPVGMLVFCVDDQRTGLPTCGEALRAPSIELKAA